MAIRSSTLIYRIHQRQVFWLGSHCENAVGNE
jgi:hypothetical protein